MMFGAIAGDIIGSMFEARPIKTTEFALFCPGSRFTDDTILTVAVADSILHDKDHATAMKEWGRKYPNAGYGGTFLSWLYSDSMTPYFSYGNGSAMRVSPVGFAFNTLEEVLEEAGKSAEATHNHPEGIKGAQATAAAVYLARRGNGRETIKGYIEDTFGYTLDKTLDEIRPFYTFDVTCQGTVPQAITAFLESTDYEDAVRKAISLGGDSDTLACIAGGIAHAYYKHIPTVIIETVRSLLTPELLRITDMFHRTFGIVV